jgi:transposase
LVDALDGRRDRPDPERGAADLAGVRAAAAPPADLEAVQGDPLFIDKVGDVVGLYLNPPERAVVLCVDEKSQIQAPDRTAPILPMLPGVPERATHDYKRAGTSSLYAALDLTTGKVIGALHSRHRAIEFKTFLHTIDREVPADLDVHLVLDNRSTHKTPAIGRWLAAHPRFVLHFTPTSSSWLNLLERWFAELTNKLLRRGAHRSVRALNADIRAWIETWNDNPAHSSGPRPPTRSSTRSPATATESINHDTSPATAPSTTGPRRCVPLSLRTHQRAARRAAGS